MPRSYRSLALRVGRGKSNGLFAGRQTPLVVDNFSRYNNIYMNYHGAHEGGSLMPRRMLAALLLALFSAAILSACGPKPPQEVQITLTEFTIESTMTTFKVGQPYRFVVTNAGTIEHEFMIMPPLAEGGMGMEMHELDEMALAMIPEEDLPPGATVTLDFTFEEPASVGELEFACHVPGHYEAGMKLPIVVER